jgi:hypothetical protein
MNGSDIEHILSIVQAEVDRQFEPIFAETAAMQRRLEDVMNRVEEVVLRIDSKSKADD